MATLPATLDAIVGQRSGFPFECVAVDSGSTDGTIDLLRARVDRLYEIPPESFDHGLTRNFGIERCRGSLVVLLVQDALPQSPEWLENLAAPLLADACVAGSFARQVPRPEASAVTRYYAERWLAHDTRPRTITIGDRKEWEALAPVARYERCVFDNVCACVRKSAWERIPFRKTPIAEDLEWARDVLLAGHTLSFAPDSVVVHSHERSCRYELHRTYLVHQRLRALFGVSTVPDIATLMRGIVTSMIRHVSCTMRDERRGRGAQLMRALGLAVAFPLGQYLGARSHDRQREFLRPAGV
jgi:rhamnosyltransferase